MAIDPRPGGWLNSQEQCCVSGGEDDEYNCDETEGLLVKEKAMLVKDRYSLAYFIFYLLGLGSSLPWSFFTTARDYWMYMLRDCNSSEQYVTTISPGIYAENNATLYVKETSATTVTNLQSLFMNSLAVCSVLSNVIFQFLNTVLQKRIPRNVRILTNLLAMTCLFILTAIVVKLNVCSWQQDFFVMTMISVVIINLCCAVFQSSVFGLAALFPSRYSGAVMTGQGIGGAFAALSTIVALALSSDPTASAFIFFLTAVAVLGLTAAGYVVLIRLKFYVFIVIQHKESNGVKEKEFALRSPSSGNGSEDHPFLDEKAINEPTSESVPSEDFKGAGSSSVFIVASKIKLHMFSVAYTFFITLSCFPALTGGIKPQGSGTLWTDVYFTPVCCFLMFNACDWLGRTIASYVHTPSPRSKLTMLVLVLLRSIFPILFMLCNYQPRNHLRVIFQGDWMFVIFMVLFAMSNGHLSTLLMQYAPKQVEPEDSGTAGSLMAFMIAVGLLSGASFSFIWTSLV